MPLCEATKPCAVCGLDFTYIEGRRGKRPEVCGDDCREVLTSFTRLRKAFERVVLPASAGLALRKELWLLGNAIQIQAGRKPGTAYWLLVLQCGHEVTYKLRRRRDEEGRSVPDPPPQTTRCATCGQRSPVLSALRRVEGQQLPGETRR